MKLLVQKEPPLIMYKYDQKLHKGRNILRYVRVKNFENKVIQESVKQSDTLINNI